MNVLISVGAPVLTTGLSLAVGWRWIIKDLVTTRVAEESQKRLKDHQNVLDAQGKEIQHDLDVSLNELLFNQRFDLSQRLQNYSIATQRQHDIYPKLFSLILESESELFQDRQIPTFENAEDCKDYCDIWFPRLARSTISAIASEVPRRPQVAYSGVLKQWLGLKAEPKYRECHNYWMRNRLYIPPATNLKIDALLQRHQHHLVLLLPTHDAPPKTKTIALREELELTMQKDLWGKAIIPSNEENTRPAE